MSNAATTHKTSDFPKRVTCKECRSSCPRVFVSEGVAEYQCPTCCESYERAARTTVGGKGAQV